MEIFDFWSTSNSLETQNTTLFFCHSLRTGAVTKLASQRHSHNVGPQCKGVYYIIDLTSQCKVILQCANLMCSAIDIEENCLSKFAETYVV